MSAILPSGRKEGLRTGSLLVVAALGTSRRRKIPASESMVVCGGTGALSSHIMMDSGWSIRFSPTPGRWWRDWRPREVSCSFGPIPEWRRRRGVSTAPAQMMVSALGVIVSLRPDFKAKFTPVTFFPERLILETQAPVRMVRLDLFSAPRRIGWM